MKQKYIELERFKTGKFIGIFAGLIFLIVYFCNVGILTERLIDVMNVFSVATILTVISFTMAIFCVLAVLVMFLLVCEKDDWFHYKQKIPVQVERRR